jgi:hypothetical protein
MADLESFFAKKLEHQPFQPGINGIPVYRVTSSSVRYFGGSVEETSILATTLAI